jgi:hydroxyacylglutathione hydrolase
MEPLEVHQFTCLDDNFGVLIHDAGSGSTASIDAPEATAVFRALDERGWELSHILVTHKHADHTQGIPALKAKTNCLVVGPERESDQFTGADQTLGDGASFDFAGHAAKVLATPGHTIGHIAYWFERDGLLFAGDTLFSLGCGRVFEGSFDQMWSSLDRLRQLPPETRVYCGHEYTQSNAKFALTVEPGNAALQARAAEVARLREAGRATLPTTIGAELQTNPFLRPESQEIQSKTGTSGRSLAEVFAAVRKAKDAG